MTLVGVAFVVCVALDQRGLFPDVMTHRSMRAFADWAVAAMTAANVRACVDAYAEGARLFGANVALTCVAECGTVARAVRAVVARATSAFER